MAEYDNDLIGDSCIAHDSDAEGIDTPASEESTPESQETKFMIPKWFIDQNMKLPSTLEDSALEIVEKKDLRKEKCTTEDKSEPNPSEQESEVDIKPQLSKDKFHEVHDILTSLLKSTSAKDASVALHGMEQKEEAFFNSLVQYFARILDANLISLNFEDLADLSEGWYSLNPENDDASTKPDPGSTYGLTEYYFGVHSAKRVSEEAKSRNQRAIAALFDALETQAKSHSPSTDTGGSTDGSNIESKLNATLIHIQNGNKIMQDGRDGFKILSRFRQAVEERRKADKPTLLLVSAFGDDPLNCWSGSDTFFCDGGNCGTLRKKLRTDITALVKIKPSDYSLPAGGADVTLARDNIKNLTRYVRRYRKDDQTKRLFDSLLGWSEPEHRDALRVLDAKGDDRWSQNDLQRAARQICGRIAGQNIQVSDIAEVLERIGRATGKKNGKEEDKENVEVLSVKERIAKIKEDDDLNKWEKILLDKIINPDELIYTYDDVIMDDETKATVKQLITFANKKIKGSSRLLQQIKLKGMLFYGPPGTGKTHLVRAIAKDSNAVMLAVDPSVINNKYCGESEKTISAIFTLAAKLHPCVVFIDEVDALFYRRSSEDKSWQRSQLTQFLQDMDGIGTQKNSPIVVTATNRPKDLDDAFLRRLPHKVLFKLPEEADRAKILRLFLQPEDLDPEVDVEKLAKSTAGFSGSDLKNLCAQAALIWAVDAAESGDEEVELLLKNSHFERARQRTQSTVSSASQDDIKAFAKKFGHAPPPAARNVAALGSGGTEWGQKITRVQRPDKVE